MKLVLFGSFTKAPVVVIFKSTVLYWNESPMMVMFPVPEFKPDVVDAWKLKLPLTGVPDQTTICPFAVEMVPFRFTALELTLLEPTEAPSPTRIVTPDTYGTQVVEP